MSPNTPYLLVLSGGGSKGFYSLGILKALEELWLKTQIEAIFGVSAGAMAASYRAAGWKPDDIRERFIEKNIFNMSHLKLPPLIGIIKSEPVREMFREDLPEKIEALQLPVYIGTTDLKKGEYHLFHQGELVPILMGSVSLPIIFPPVNYQDYLLVDGGVLDNFPVKKAKNLFPDKEIIGVTQSQFKKNQPITGIISMTQVCFNLIFSRKVEENKKLTHHLFYKNTGLSTTDNNTEKIRKVYHQGYQDGLQYFSTI